MAENKIDELHTWMWSLYAALKQAVAENKQKADFKAAFNSERLARIEKHLGITPDIGGITQIALERIRMVGETHEEAGKDV